MKKTNFFNSGNKPSWLKHVLVALIGILFDVVIYYIFLPPINVHSVGFWVFITVALLPYVLPYAVVIKKGGYKKSKSAQNINIRFDGPKIAKILFSAAFVPVLIAIIGGIFSSTFFFARSYASVIEVNESVFEEDLPETEKITQIALMDSESAEKLGNKTLGSLSDVVSQFEVALNYTQINYKDAPQKVANLEYGGFFKWLNNRKTGIPGIVMVDPVNFTSQYIKLERPMLYAESAYFLKDLERKLRFDYPTKIFDSISFEIDESGNPYYIVSCASATVSLFGAMDIKEVIIFDPTTGDSTISAVEDTPAWVDIVYTGDLACEKYNWQGTLSGGFFNSIIGNKGCKRSTDDFGYIALEDDVWYFTGVTSVSGDQSNIGFILSNARTGEYKFYPVIGADEHSAMAAAEGEVQEKGYVASFPSLVNIYGQPSYIMVLKDAAGIVKRYAIVNVENYGTVATAERQEDAIEAYRKLLKPEDVEIPEEELIEGEIEVKDVRLVNVFGTATVYITAENGYVYKGSLEDDESLVLIQTGDRIKIKYALTDTVKLFKLSSWELME